MKRHFGSLVCYWILLAIALAVSAIVPQAQSQSTGSVALAPLSPKSGRTPVLPDGDGKAIVAGKCRICHAVSEVARYRRPKEEWKEVVDTMIVRGAPLGPEEASTVVNYLSTNFGLKGSSRLTEPAESASQGSGKILGAYRLYVSNQESPRIDVIDPATNKIAQTITGITSPDGIIFSADGHRAYISDRVEHVVAVVDTREGAVIKKIPVSDRPQLPVMSKDGKLIYVGIWPIKPDDSKKGAIDVIDTASLQKIKTIPTTGGIHDLQVTTDGKYLIAGSPMGQFLDVYDLRTDQLAWKVPFDRNVQTFTSETAPDGSTSRIFVNLRIPGFAVVDFATHKEVARILFPTDKGTQPSADWFAPVVEGGRTPKQLQRGGAEPSASSYIADNSTGGGYLVPNGSASAHGINIHPDGKTLWVDAMGYKTPWSNTVYIYSLPDLKPQGDVPMSELYEIGKPEGRGGGGHWQSFSPDGKMLYVCNSGLDSISVIDVKARKEVARVAVGETPLHIETLVIK